jgi:hypothetical protein
LFLVLKGRKRNPSLALLGRARVMRPFWQLSSNTSFSVDARLHTLEDIISVNVGAVTALLAGGCSDVGGARSGCAP